MMLLMGLGAGALVGWMGMVVGMLGGNSGCSNAGSPVMRCQCEG